MPGVDVLQLLVKLHTNLDGLQRFWSELYPDLDLNLELLRRRPTGSSSSEHLLHGFIFLQLLLHLPPRLRLP